MTDTDACTWADLVPDLQYLILTHYLDAFSQRAFAFTCRRYWAEEGTRRRKLTYPGALKPLGRGFMIASSAPTAYVHHFVRNLSCQPKSWWRSLVVSFSFSGIHDMADYCRGIVAGLIKAGDRTDVLMELATYWAQDSKFRYEVDFNTRGNPPVPLKVIAWIFEGCAMTGTVALANEMYGKYGQPPNDAYHHGSLAAKCANMAFLADWHYLFHYAHSADDVSKEKMLLRVLIQHGNTEWALLFQDRPSELGPIMWLTALHQLTFNNLYYSEQTGKTSILMEEKYGAPLDSIASLWPWFSKEQHYILRLLAGTGYTWPKDEELPPWARKE